MTLKYLSQYRLAVVLLLTVIASPAHATNELRNKLQLTAQNILKISRDQPVTVGQFSPTGLPDSNTGPGIEETLTKELEILSPGSVRANAKFEVKGDYAFVRSRKSPELKEIKILVRLIDKEFGDEIANSRITTILTGTNSIAETLQLTAMLDPDGSKEERNKALDDTLKHPSVHIHGKNNTQISSSPRSEYAVEMLVKPLMNHKSHQAKPRSATDTLKNGFAFVGIEKGELFEVKVYNNSDREVAVALSVDGIDMHHFSQDRKASGHPRFTHSILAPHSTRTIVGWHNKLTGNDNYLSFLVTSYGKGAVSKAGKARGKVGIIHAQFSYCNPLPKGARARSGTEVGFGPPRDIKERAATYEIDPPHDFVSVRYNRPTQK